MADQLTVEREYVEKAWEHVEFCHSDLVYWLIFGSADIQGVRLYTPDPYKKTEAEAIHAAYLFAKKRKQEIADGTKGLQILQNWLSDPLAQHYEEEAELLRQIAVRERDRLTDLRRGWKL